MQGTTFQNYDKIFYL